MSKKHKNKSVKPIQDTLLDIIIPVMNRFDLLEKCIQSISSAANEIKYNLILVDNASEKDKADQFYASLDKAIVIRNKENMGFPRACNQGASRKYSPLILFLNSDVILETNAIFNLVKTMDNPTIGVAGMKLLFPDEEQIYDAKINSNIRPAQKVQHVGMFCNLHGDFFHAYIGWSADNPKVLAIKDAYAVTGAALITRRNIWNKAGGFYEGYGIGTYEDIDFCLTVRDMGYNIVIEQTAVGTHYVGATAEQHKISYPLQYNRLIFLQRWANRLNYTSHIAW